MKLKYFFVLGIFIIPFLLSGQEKGNADDLMQNYIHSSTKLKSINNIEYEVNLDQYDDQSGIRKVHALQKLNGIYVREGLITLTYGRDKRLFSIDEFTNKKAKSSNPDIDVETALMNAMRFHKMSHKSPLIIKENKKAADQHVIFERNDVTASDIQARLMYIQTKRNDELTLTWETQLHTADRQNYWITYVDAQSGKVLDSNDMVLHCSFGDGLVYDASPEEQALIDAQHHKMHMESARKWDEMFESRNSHTSCSHNHDNLSPKANQTSAMAPANTYLVLDLPAEAPNDMSTTSTQTIVTTAGDPTASPFGWTSTDGITENTFTKGNNAYAFYDPSPGPLGGVPNTATSAQATGVGQFIYPWDLTKEPEFATMNPTNQFPNRNAAIVNLFYWNNLVHDIFYNFGFTEAGRNFQFDNFMKGGTGNDEVLAQAQDGGGTNNANFLTLADGANGQMQMYLWTSSTPDSLVQITSVDIPTTIMGGDKFEALQGALYNPTAPIDINANPVLNKNYVLVNDGCGSPEGCGMGGGVGSIPCNTVTDAIVLIDRGSCSFVEKVDGAQKGGAAGVIIMNNDTGNPDAVVAMGGTDPTLNTITIPSVMVSFNTGLLLKAALASGATVVGSLQQDNPPIPKRDGDFDNGIIAHEYGHGISTRTSPQTATGGSLGGDEQGGEGWSDYYALYLTTTQSDLKAPTAAHPNGILPDRGIGTYVTYVNSDGPGIRPRRYSVDMGVNEYTFAGSTNGGFGIGNAPEITIPHGVGFVWCTMLCELTQSFVDEYGFNDDKYYNPPLTGAQSDDIQTLRDNNAGNSVALKLIQEGISLQSARPRFVDMRDGILKADTLLYGAAHSCLIWEAFAKRGLGANAQDPTNDIGDEVDGFGVPMSCNADQVFYDIVKTSSVSSVGNLENISYTLTVTNTSPTGSTGTNVVVVDALPSGMTFINASGAPFTEINNIVTFTIPSIAANAFTVLNVEALVNNPVTSTILEEYDYEANAQGWSVASGGFNTFSRVNDPAEAHGGDFYFYTTNFGLGGSNTTLTSPNLDPTLTNQQIRFWHKFDAQAGFDGGFLETTTDGLTWTRLPLQENGYNGALNSTFNPANAGVAFTGTQVSYIESAGLLPAGTTQVRFVFTEDTGFGGGDGWFIDDVLIVQNPITITNAASVTDPVANGGRIHTSDVTVLITPFVCPIDLLITTGNIPDMTNHYAQNSIIVNGNPVDVLVLQGSDVSLRAGNFVEATAGFEVKLGALFLMDIDVCP